MAETDRKPEQLLPCPFCGENLKATDNASIFEHAYVTERGIPFKKCWLSGSKVDVVEGGLWNMRTTPETQPQAIPFDPTRAELIAFANGVLTLANAKGEL